MAYKEASSRTLEHIILDAHLFRHLAALRKYLFLLQGDFAAYLLEALVPELGRPATKLYRYNLIGILDSAIRSINSQEDEAALTRRLDVCLSDVRRHIELS